MSIPFTRWPEEFARRYREKGYWQDLPLTDILTRHADSDKTAVIDGERHLSYRELNQAADNLACSLRRQGIKPGETALVQLGNELGHTIKHIGQLCHAALVVHKELFAHGVVVRVIRRHAKCHAEHAACTGTCHGPVQIGGKRCQPPVSAHLVRRSAQIGRTVNQGAVQVKKDGLNARELHDFRVACR